MLPVERREVRGCGLMLISSTSLTKWSHQTGNEKEICFKIKLAGLVWGLTLVFKYNEVNKNCLPLDHKRECEWKNLWKWYRVCVRDRVRVSAFQTEKFCTKGQQERWLARRAAGEIGWKTRMCSHGISLQTRSSSFYWFDKGHSWRSPPHSKHQPLSTYECQHFLCFPYQNWLHPGGFNTAFAQQARDHTCINQRMLWWICMTPLSPVQTEWKCSPRQ